MKTTSPGGTGAGGKPPAQREKIQKHRSRPSGGGRGRLALILAVVGLVVVVVFLIPRQRNKTGGSLPPATSISSSPINISDPTSGKPVVPGITSVYKGYTIGHCCVPSKGDWEALSVERKEAFVRAYVR